MKDLASLINGTVMCLFCYLKEDAMKFIPGLYRHYKGKYYEAIEVCKNSETLEEMVIYQALYDDEILWARPLKMFYEEINVNGKMRPRFRHITYNNEAYFKELSKEEYQKYKLNKYTLGVYLDNFLCGYINDDEIITHDDSFVQPLIEAYNE